jgi:hypothetical protein
MTAAQASARVNMSGARNARGGLPDADPNLTFLPMDRRGVGGLPGKYQEMMQTHVGIAAAVYWAINEGSALPKEVVWTHNRAPGTEELAFMDLCRAACIEDAVVYEGMIEGGSALWSYPLLDTFMGFGLMFPRRLNDTQIEWYPVAHNAVMLWRPDGHLFGGARFSTPNGYDDLDADQLVHTVYGTAGAMEFEGRSMLRDCLQPFELWKQIAINAGIYNQLSWGFLDIAYEPSVTEDDIDAFNTFGQQFSDGQRKYLLRPKQVDVEMRYPSGTPPAIIEQLEYWDRQIEKKLNAPLAGIAQFGSRAMAETLDGAAGRKAKAWLNNVFDRASRGMFQWLARDVGYTGKLPRVQVQSAEMTTGMDGWAAYVQGVQAGLLTRGPGDEAWARKVIGAPELPVQEGVEVDAETPAPLLVGSLQIAQQVLGMLVATPANPAPLAPEAAALLLVSAGMSRTTADSMIAAQLAMPKPMAAPVEGLAPASPETAAAVVPQVQVSENIEVPAVIGDSSAFKPVSTAASETMMAESDVDLAPTAGMVEAAARALEWRREHGRGGTEVGVARARDISNGKNLSADTVRRMASFFARHDVDSSGTGFNSGEEGFPSAGRIAWDLWGGDAGKAWAERKVAELERAAGDLADRAVILSASLAERPDVVVPDSVRSAAAAALEAHRSVSKGKTSDTEALLIARDLAAGKRLAWSRVMRLAEWFSATLPRVASTKSFTDKGACYHSYQLRGGNECKQWVRGLMMAYASAAHHRAARLNEGCSCGESHGDLADGEGEGVLVVGGDGKEFLAPRELRPEELVVGWVTLAESRQDLDAKLSMSIEAIASAHRGAVKEALKNGWQAGERDIIYYKFLDLYSKALSNNAAQLRTAVQGDVLDEARKSLPDAPANTMPAAEVADASAAMATMSNAQFAQAAALTQTAAETITNRVQTEVENALLAGADPATWVSRITPLGLLDSARDSRNMVEAAARTATYAQAPTAVGAVPTFVVRSSIPDGKRCSICAAADTGERVRVSDYVTKGVGLELPPLPDPNCLGGAGRCRCGWFAIYSR